MCQFWGYRKDVEMVPCPPGVQSGGEGWRTEFMDRQVHQ